MNISINWLKKYVNIENLSVKEISDGLTLAGLEAEGFNELTALNNVVTAKVIHKEKHPNADKLSLCRVFDGKDEYQVVCGAANVDKDLIVPFAKIGAVVGDIKIKEAKLRGVESFGMICSEKELGIATESNGIMILPEDTPLGLDINEVVGLGDTIVEFNVTPNRPDWLSVIGVAREAAAVFGAELTLPKKELKCGSEKSADLIKVNVADSEKCPIYTARVIKGVKVAPSPLWLQAKLRAAGLRPKNNIVDITNYILMEYGQPLHAFDLKKVNGDINIRNASDKEMIKALDGKDYELTSDMLVIADNNSPIAIAGVMGGMDSAVSDDTTDIILECAYFEPVTIRKASKKLGLSSDSSYRFERGIDYGKTLEIADYAAAMIVEICGGSSCQGVSGGTFKTFESKSVTSSVSAINKLLGADFKADDMVSALNRLGIKSSLNGDNIISNVPTHRNDIERMADIAEEVARIIGYDKIGYTMPHTDNDIDIQSPKVRYTRLVRNRLESLGFNEAVNFSFMGSDYLSLFDKEENFVKLINPISTDMAWMRTYLFPSLIKNMQTNRNQGYNSIKLFEISATYKSQGKDKLAEERPHLALGVMGDFNDVSWISFPKLDTFFYLKGILENIFAVMGLNAEYKRLEDCPFMHPGKSASIIVNDKEAGFIGKIHPDFEETLDIKAPCYIAEVDFKVLVDESYEANEKHKSTMKYKKFSRFPSVERDLALIVKTNVSAHDMITTIKKEAELITDVKVFDVFEGKPINFGYKSIAVRINFTDMEKTLRDEDINPIIENILKMLELNYGAVLR